MSKKPYIPLLAGALLLLAVSPPLSADVGQALYERWGTPGSADSMLTETALPDYTEIVTSAQWGIGDDNAIDQYRARITGWLIPPVTGNYTFSIVTDDNGRLWLSTDSSPDNAQLIASVPGWAAENTWTKYPEQTSAPIHLLAGQAYWIRGGYQEGGGGDHIQIAWGCPEAGIPANTIIDGLYLSDTAPFNAYSPSPKNGAVHVPVEDVQLSWRSPGAIAGATYNVYFGSDPNDLSLLASGLAESQVLAGTLDTATTYVWQVDIIDPNEGGTPVIIPGNLWTFTTAPATPVILKQPQNVLVFAGEAVAFTVEAYSANGVPLSYKWFKEDAPGTILSETDTLTIPSAQSGDEGAYRCTVSNSFGDTVSDSATLTLKKVIGHWPFENNLNDIVGGHHGTTSPAPEFVPGIIGESAIRFGPNSRAVTVSPAAHTGGSWSFSFWENSAEDLGGEWEILIAASQTDGYENIDFGREYLIYYYVGIHEDYPATPQDIFERGQWHLLVLTYDAETKKVRLFADGIQILDFDKTFTGFGANVSFGGDRANGYPYFGTLDDMKFYNYALSAEEIAWLYYEGTGKKTCLQHPHADVSGPDGVPDCLVDIHDLAEMAQAWLQCNRIPADNCL